MASKKAKKNSTGNPTLDKLLSLPGGEEFHLEVERLSTEVLEARISAMQKSLDESREHKENNESLKHIRSQLSEITGPYNDIEKSVRFKTKYLIELIKEKGGA